MRSAVTAALAVRAAASGRAGRCCCSRSLHESDDPQATTRTTLAAVSCTARLYSTASNAEAGPSRLPSAGSDRSARPRAKKHPKARRIPRQPALLRLDPSRPLIPSLTPAASSNEIGKSENLQQRRAKGLTRLHAALQTGTADAAWLAYLDLRQHTAIDPESSSNYQSLSQSPLTPQECASVAKIISNDATKTKRGANRILRLTADVRSQQRRLLAQLQHTADTNDSTRSRLIRKELSAWDDVVSPYLLNVTISHIGRSLRNIGLEEIDQILDQLLTFEANEHSRQTAGTRDNSASSQLSSLNAAGALQHLRTAMLSPVAQASLASRRRGTQRQAGFPDLMTYNTILDIITRTVQRSKANHRSESRPPAQSFEEEDDDELSKFAEEQIDSHSAELSASIANRLRRLDLDPDAVSVHVDALERADRLFHSVLERMQRKSRIEPDAITFNIMVTMYCLLSRWDMVHRAVRSANERGLLGTDCINNVLGHWLVRGPASGNRDDRDISQADAIELALEIYRQLRQNVVRAELASRHSSIAYGKGNAKSVQSARANEEDGDSQDAFAPLSWPDRDDAESTGSSVKDSKNDAVEAVLGISLVPLQCLPDEITHALIINSLTREGRFADALSVFKDLVSTPIREAVKDSSNARPSSEESEERQMQPTLAIFDSFFRGFSRHGRPSTITALDLQSPERSQWELVPREAAPDADNGDAPEEGPVTRQLQLWRIDTFQEIFAAFLRFEPDIKQALRRRATGQSVDRSKRSTYRNISTPFGWLTLAEMRRLDAARRAPSTNQLFWILTAIRRVSHDHPAWSLAMWGKVVDKFDPQLSKSANGVGWSGFRLDNRVRRVVEHLEARLAQDDDAGEPVSTRDEA
ncbi:hypothetical protein PHBOTO_005718 [Pseudozyma hubeiensis]|nr:hypothetical protein PHBOTO_005718 [Pseudozyma hubeiensis]